MNKLTVITLVILGTLSINAYAESTQILDQYCANGRDQTKETVIVGAGKRAYLTAGDRSFTEGKVSQQADKKLLSTVNNGVDKNDACFNYSLKRYQAKPEARVTFAFDKANLTPATSSVLDKVKSDQAQYVVGGHTDSIGTDSYNATLSEKRAFSVAEYLEQQGVIGTKIQADAYGEKAPIELNDTKSGRALNRRVEVNLSE
jgi:outer membrane protein OmpA-like peptidoglycan-associated protein